MLDKFYTKSNIVDLILEKINLDSYDIIIEPSAGNGSFIDGIKRKNYKGKIIAFDIEPEKEDILKKDFLKLNIINSDKTILTLGNPPFGRNSSLALKFINKASIYSEAIGFILSKSFRKESMQNKIPLDFHLDYEIILPEYSFYEDNKDKDVPTVFQFWIKKEYKRKKSEKLKSEHFEFCKYKDCDIIIRRVGWTSGATYLKDEDEERTSNYYIRVFEKNKINDVKEILNSIKWEHDKTVGPRSISQNEIIKEFEKIKK